VTAQPVSSPGSAARRGTLRRDATLVAVGQLVAVSSAFLLTVVGARLLPADDFGALSWALSWLALLAVLAQSGLTQVSTIAFAREDAAAGRVLLWRLLGALAVGVTAVVLLWTAALGPLAAGTGTPTAVYRPLVLVVALWVPVAAVGPVLADVLRARARFGLALLLGEHVRRVVLVGVLVAAAGASHAPSLRTLLWWAVGIETAVYLAGLLVVVGVVGAPAPGTVAASPWRLLRRGSSFTLATLASVTVPQAGVWLLATLAPVGQVAVFAVAVRIAVLLAVPTAIVMRTLAPRIASAAATGRLAELQAPIRRTASWSTAVTALAVLVLAAAGPWLVPAVFGPGYAGALAPALVMCVGVLVNAWTGPCSVVLSHAGHERLVAGSALVSAVAFFGLGSWWGAAWGGTGVAAAAAVAMSARNLYLARAARQRSGIRTIATTARGEG
jgi:O-antigen/teichoic acid export membrane protein